MTLAVPTKVGSTLWSSTAHGEWRGKHYNDISAIMIGAEFIKWNEHGHRDELNIKSPRGGKGNWFK